MTITESPLDVTLNPSKILFLAQLGLFVILVVTLFLVPALWWARLLVLIFVLASGYKWLLKWRASGDEVLRFLPREDTCLLASGLACKLRPRQFVTGPLIIFYLQKSLFKTLIRVIPRDSLSNEHLRLLHQFLLRRPAVSLGE
jgi:hypothetical protein